MDFNRDCSYIRAMSPDMGPSSSPRPDITMVQDGNQSIHLSLLLMSSTLPLLIFREKTKHSISLSPTPHHSLAHHNSTCLPGCRRLQVGLCFLCGAWGRSTQVCVWVSLACSGRHGPGWCGSGAGVLSSLTRNPWLRLFEPQPHKQHGMGQSCCWTPLVRKKARNCFFTNVSLCSSSLILIK